MTTTPAPTNRIKEFRERSGLTWFEVAQRLGVREPTLYRWHKGTHVPPLDMMHKLCEIFDCTLDELFPAPSEASA